MNPEIIYSSSFDLYEAWKFVVAAGFALWLAAGFTACGVTAGPVTVGTTSFLAEANRGRIALDNAESTPSVIAAKQSRGGQ